MGIEFGYHDIIFKLIGSFEPEFYDFPYAGNNYPN